MFDIQFFEIFCNRRRDASLCFKTGQYLMLCVNCKSCIIFVCLLFCVCNSALIYSKDVVKQQSSAKAENQNLVKLEEGVLKHLGNFEGKAISLEPLEPEKCFGEAYEEVQVRTFLNSLYRDDLPVNGMGLFLGLDKRSVAIKNKEYRYTFIPGKSEEEKEIFIHVFRFSKGLYNLIGFKDKQFDLTATTEKEIISAFDAPAIYIESAGSTIEEIESFKPYRSLYWKLAKNFEEDRVKQAIQEIKSELLASFISSQNRNVSRATKVRMKSFSGMFDFSDERFDIDEFGLKRISLTNTYMYGYYVLQFRNDKVRNDKKILREGVALASIAFQQALLRHFFGATITKPYFSGVSPDTILTIKGNNGNTVFDAPSAFEKSLFLSIYQRIKPLNMNKTTFIDSVVAVMQPCLSKSSSKG